MFALSLVVIFDNCPVPPTRLGGATELVQLARGLVRVDIKVLSLHFSRPVSHVLSPRLQPAHRSMFQFDLAAAFQQSGTVIAPVAC